MAAPAICYIRRPRAESTTTSVSHGNVLYTVRLRLGRSGWRRRRRAARRGGGERKKHHLYPTIAAIGSDADVVK